MNQQRLDAANVLSTLADALGPTVGENFDDSSDFLPCFSRIVNFSQNAGRPSHPHLKLPRRKLPELSNCVMCNRECRLGISRKIMNSELSGSESESSNTLSTYFIPRQNKGLCNECDSKVWVMVEFGKKIKWCKGCKNFRILSAFGGKEMATKCTKCRNRQRENYANQKEVRLRQENRRPSPSTTIESIID